MFRAIAALTLASAATHPATAPAAAHSATPPAAGHAPAVSAAAHEAATPLPSSPWWERVTVTISGDGKPQGCKFESSLKPTAPQACDVVGKDASAATSASGAKAEYTRITFERRFTPGVQPNAANLQPGETLIGGQVMALGIDTHGAVKTCKVVSESGSMRPQYGCAEATAEKFEASAATAREPAREGYMTVMVYGHSEHVV